MESSASMIWHHSPYSQACLRLGLTLLPQFFQLGQLWWVLIWKQALCVLPVADCFVAFANSGGQAGALMGTLTHSLRLTPVACCMCVVQCPLTVVPGITLTSDPIS